jgi:hypothetical protein
MRGLTKKFHFLNSAILLCFWATTAFSQEKPNMMANVPATEATFTNEQLQEYYLVYQNKAVRHIRTVVDRYLKNPKKLDGETEILRKIDKAYLTGKFFVLSRNPGIFGYTNILILAADKPDKVIKAAVYTGGELRLDYFEIDPDYNAEDMRITKIRYRTLLSDTKHSL